jgi:AraC-like DNA-binding protein
LPGENGGIRQVRDSLLTASYIYPTRGDLLLQVALDILEGHPYEKEILLTSALVTRDNANVLLLEGDEVMRRAKQLELLQAKASGYLQQLNVQRVVMLLAGIVIVLLLIAIGLFYLYHRNKVGIQRERVVQNLWNASEGSSHQLTAEGTTPAQTHSAPLPHREEQGGGSAESAGSVGSVGDFPAFITRFKEVVEKRMDDSKLSVEDIAADMNLSRVQLYRKVKALSGSSPVELLRTARLNRGYQMLLTTDKTVSEVAYAVGFSAPAYFTKCFKDEFGMVPGDVRK